MKLYKEIFGILLEISCAIFLIIFGYSIWDNFEPSSINIAEYYDNNNDTELLIEKELDGNIEKVSDETNVKSASVYLHNISRNNNSISLILKISKNIAKCKDYLIVKVDDIYYNLNNLIYKEDTNYYYIKINNSSFNSYETKDYKIKILSNDDYSNCNNIKFSYSFFAEV